MAGRAAPTDYDVLIVGAGISGIGMAAHMEEIGRASCRERV